MEGGRWPSVAPNLADSGGASSLAKASEDMSKGARGGRGEEKFAPQLRDPACAGKFGIRNSKIGEWASFAPQLRDYGGFRGLD